MNIMKLYYPGFAELATQVYSADSFKYEDDEYIVSMGGKTIVITYDELLSAAEDGGSAGALRMVKDKLEYNRVRP